MYKTEIRKVEVVIANYFEGIFNGDINKLKACFHENITIYGEIEGITFLKNRNEYFEIVKNRQSPKSLNEISKMKIIGIDIIGGIAMAKLHVPMLGFNYYDYLSLYQIDQEWKIVNKLFTHVE